MEKIVMCIFVFCLFGCEQKPDEYYVGKENAIIVSQLQNTFYNDFDSACNGSHQTENETLCISAYVEPECTDLWERKPYPYYDSSGELDEWSETKIENWGEELDKFNGTCPRDPAEICGSSQSDVQLQYVLSKRDNLRGKIQLTDVQKDNLPKELKGLIYDDWICNWWSNNWSNETIRFGKPGELDENF